MSRFNPSSESPLMALVKTTAGIDLLGWIVRSCEHTLTLEITETEQLGWIVTLPWEHIDEVHDVTEFMTRRRDQTAV